MKITQGLIFVLAALLIAPAVKGQKSETAIPIFAYHRFGDSRYPSTNIEMDVFKKQLRYLEENNYSVMTLGNALKAIDNNNLPKNPAILTVDDGYLSFFENAFPVLKEYGYPATIFINTSYVGNKSYMNWSQLEKLHEAGIEIGNHSHAHPHFVNSDDPVEAFEDDVSRAQELFKKHLGFKPEVFSYPYGEYTRKLADKAENMGFIAATAQRSGVLGASTYRFAIPRFPMGGPFATMKGFKSKIKMLPLEVEMTNPESTLDYQVDKVRFRIETPVHESTIQCFIDGRKQEVKERTDYFEVDMPSLSDRRTLITITARGQESNSWHWFSYVVINKAVEEK
ncbi:MAG: polysaccharide deacetylase family protein [Bacteroidales bacterium]|nr:polysaccharide deacetylase family protein [Bacteroidales bacterium]MCF8334669.1 polysaccharide deacetylase family protein [Bacteroidales bacterium]